MWCFFFGMFIRYLTRRNYGLYREKIQFYSLLGGLYYHMKVDYASFLWEEFTSYVTHAKKVTEIASWRFWSLALIEAYQHASIHVLEGEDDPENFLVIGRIIDAMLELVPLSNHVLIRYHEMHVNVPRVPTPMKTKSKSKGVVVIKEPSGEEPQQK